MVVGNYIFRPIKRPPVKGLLIVFEGIDGTGKATLSKKLVDHIKEKYPDKECIHLSYPRYDTDNGKIISQYLNDEIQMDQHDIMRIFANDRYNDYLTNWKKKYEDGAIIVSDRYTFSNMIHNNINESLVIMYEFVTLGLPHPEITFILNCDNIDTVMRRLENRGGNKHDGKELDKNETRENLLEARARLNKVKKLIGYNSVETHEYKIDTHPDVESSIFYVCDKRIDDMK